MTTLIACLTTGKGTWTEVQKLMVQEDWENIVLITNAFGKEKFTHQKDHKLLVYNFEKPMDEIVSAIKKDLAEIIPSGFATEIALNLSSGVGKEHMVILSAVLKAGLGFRLVVSGESTIEEI